MVLKSGMGKKRLIPVKQIIHIVQRERAQAQRLEALHARLRVGGGEVRHGIVMELDEDLLEGRQVGGADRVQQVIFGAFQVQLQQVNLRHAQTLHQARQAERFHLVTARFEVAHVVVVSENRAAFVGEALVEGERAFLRGDGSLNVGETPAGFLFEGMQGIGVLVGGVHAKGARAVGAQHVARQLGFIAAAGVHDDAVGREALEEDVVGRDETQPQALCLAAALVDFDCAPDAAQDAGKKVHGQVSGWCVVTVYHGLPGHCETRRAGRSNRKLWVLSFRTPVFTEVKQR